MYFPRYAFRLKIDNYNQFNNKIGLNSFLNLKYTALN